MYITLWAIAQKCSKGLSRLGGSFRSPGFANKLSDRHNFCRERLRWGLLHRIKIPLQSVNSTGLQRYPTYKAFSIFFHFFTSLIRLQLRRLNRFLRKIRQKIRSSARKCLWGVKNATLNIQTPFWGKNP